ncbi:hypothetical protein ACFO5O_11860 [Geojedonia litorea]|uniref:Lipoprotein n=1 Tax=Geojedonia litorea TaxID=1268269 RepID=A0ABV9N7S1_9FLAO
MRGSKFYILILILLSISCKNLSEKAAPVALEVNANNNITESDIEKLDYVEYNLSSDARNVLQDWQKYNELQGYVSFLKTLDFSFFNEEKTILKTFLNDFNTEMPQSIKTAPILSRAKVLETKLLKLNSVMRLDNMDKATQLEAIQEFLTALSNFNLQVNKKFELEANLVDKEVIEQ